MIQPNVVSTIYDPRRDVTFKFVAYRELSRQELVRNVRVFLMQNRKKLKKGTTITVMTIIGHNDYPPIRQFHNRQSFFLLCSSDICRSEDRLLRPGTRLKVP